jgi:xylulokinase
MGAILSGASCLRWATRLLGEASELAFLEKIEASVPLADAPPRDAPLFLPYIAGERTPHNDPLLRGGFMKLGVETSRGQLGYAVLEGVAFALRDAMAAVEASGVPVTRCALVGGGAKSDYWAQLLANVLDRELYTLQGSELGAGMGAAMLGFAAVSDKRISFDRPLPVKATFIPQRRFAAVYDDRYREFQSLLPAAIAVRVGAGAK